MNWVLAGRDAGIAPHFFREVGRSPRRAGSGALDTEERLPTGSAIKKRFAPCVIVSELAEEVWDDEMVK
ncbi:MAG: hypothetical protein M3065_05270 [Actinomycetota bacterium]|nr:hypothetical protein [Actinomycetota bacterium]